MLYFCHDRLIDDTSFYKALALINITQRLEIDLRRNLFCNAEGYWIERFYVQVPSEEAMLKLREETKRNGFEVWVNSSEDNFQELVQINGIPLPSLKDIPEYYFG
jgi:hypothetical protein